MAVPSSGPLQLRGDIALEVDGSATGTDVSLGTLSNSAGFTEPDTMSEFYGYSSVSAPSVTTDAASSVTSTSMQLNGNVTADNGASVTETGFYFGTDSNYLNNTKTSVGSGLGTYNLSKTSLSFSTTYYITAYAVNSAGEGVGSTISQATNAATPVSVTANPSFSSVTVSSMTTSASFSNPDGLSVTYKVYFGTSSNYASNTLYTITTNSNTSYSPSKNFTGLNASTTYYARFVAQVSGLSDVQTTTTSQATPALATYQFAGATVYHQCSMPSAFSSAWAGTYGGSNSSCHYIAVSHAFQYNHANYGYTNLWSVSSTTTCFSGASGASRFSGDNSTSAYTKSTGIAQRTDQTQDTVNRVRFYHYTSRQIFDASNYFYTGANLIHRIYQQSVPSSIYGRSVSSYSTTTTNKTCGSTYRYNQEGAYGLKGYNAFSCSANHNAVFGDTWISTFTAP